MKRRFEWDEVKNRANRKKHGVSFEDAAAVFSDPLHVTTQDGFVAGEERWKTFGMVDSHALIMVAHCYRDDNETEVIRIISARLATRRERDVYEQETG